MRPSIYKVPRTIEYLHEKTDFTKRLRHIHFHFLEVMKITIDRGLISRPSSIIGRPQDCVNVEQDLENSDLCQVTK